MTSTSTTTTSSSLEEFDIRESFDAMDDEKLGLLSMDQFYTLYLGLGYHPQVTLEDMKSRVRGVQEKLHPNGDKRVTIDVAIQVLSKFKRDRQSEMSACFTLVDHEKKGFISAQDIERLSVIVGQPMSLDEARTLLTLSSNGSETMLRERDFEKIFSPPSPP